MVTMANVEIKFQAQRDATPGIELLEVFLQEMEKLASLAAFTLIILGEKYGDHDAYVQLQIRSTESAGDLNGEIEAIAWFISNNITQRPEVSRTVTQFFQDRPIAPPKLYTS